MNRRKHIFAHHTLRNDHCVLIVVSFPRHVCHKKVASQSKLTILGSVTLSKDVTLLYSLSLVTNWAKVDGHVLVSATELRNAIFLKRRLKADKLIILCAVIKDTNRRGVNIVYDTITLSRNHCARILTHLLFKAGSYDWRVIVKQWDGLSHHVTSHQRTVTIIMLQERNETC